MSWSEDEARKARLADFAGAQQHIRTAAAREGRDRLVEEVRGLGYELE